VSHPPEVHQVGAPRADPAGANRDHHDVRSIVAGTEHVGLEPNNRLQASSVASHRSRVTARLDPHWNPSGPGRVAVRPRPRRRPAGATAAVRARGPVSIHDRPTIIRMSDDDEIPGGPGIATLVIPMSGSVRPPTDTAAAMLTWLSAHGEPRTAEVLRRL
jgi:hypothetical protein